MGNEVLLDYHRMFKQACAFVDCAKYCRTEPNNIEYRTQFHTVSGIVNSAFACEVFIKSLLAFHNPLGKKIKKHELKELWKRFKEYDGDTALLVERNMRELFNSQNENMFSELLNNISNAFDDWRYIYETDSCSLNINFLICFTDLLKGVCCKKFYDKSWDEYIKDSP